MSEVETFTRSRDKLQAKIVQDTAETSAWTGRSVLSARVLDAMARVPRHEFVHAADRSRAYENRPLSIGYGQTISQPFIVAIMTELLDLQAGDRVLEIGTGCGYQTAVLAELATAVFSIEAVPELAITAEARLQALGYHNVVVRCGDGFLGWPDEAPFNAIVVTAAPDHIPPTLEEQLATGGRMVIPAGLSHEAQMLFRCEKASDGSIVRAQKLPVAFVPMVPGSQRLG